MNRMDTENFIGKIKDFCATVLSQPEYQEMRQMVDQFAADKDAVKQYEQFMDIHEALQQKEEQNIELDQAEIASYEKEEQTLYGNDSIRRFLLAQREFNKIHHLVSQFFIKAIELNRVPELKDLDRDTSCGCGGNCGSGYPVN